MTRKIVGKEDSDEEKNFVIKRIGPEDNRVKPPFFYIGISKETGQPEYVNDLDKANIFHGRSAVEKYISLITKKFSYVYPIYLEEEQKLLDTLVNSQSDDNNNDIEQEGENDGSE